MKLKISLLILLMVGCFQAMAQQPAADFSAINAQGDTIYYNILDSTARTVAVTNVVGGLEIDTLPYYPDFMNPDSVIYGDTVLYHGDLVIPDSVVHNDTTYQVTTLGTNAFCFNTELRSVTLPSTITTIEKHVFVSCDSLKEFTIPLNITTLKDSAFRDNANLTTIHWDARKITHYGEYIDWYNSFYRPFIGSPIETVVFGNEVREIPDYAFSDIETVDSITFGNNISKIGEFAFFNCHLVTHFDLPNSLIEIKDYAFRQCRGISAIVIPNSVVNMHEYIFADCSSLKNVTLPNGIQKIPNGIFYHCDSLARFDIPNTVTIIGRSAFRACFLLDSIMIPNSVHEIQIDAFAGCRTLSEINIPASVNDLGNAFDYCPNLKQVYWNAPSFADNMFGSYDAWEGAILYPFNGSTVEKVEFGDTVEMIPHYAFQESEQLDTLIIGKNVTHIDHNAFSGCSNLSYIRIDATIPPVLATTAFNYVDSNINIYVSCHALDTFLTDPNWARFTNIQSYNSCHQITATSNDETWGTVTGGGVYPSETVATLEAFPMEHYQFVDWNDGNTDNPRAVMVSQDSTFTANFAILTYQVNVESNNSKWGTVVGDSTYNHGDIATIEAIPNEGCRFVSWNDGHTENPRHIVVTHDSTFTATFTIAQHHIIVMSGNTQWGTVSEGGIYPHGDTITIEATATVGYHFVNWSDGNTENPRRVAVTHDSIFIANFAISQYHINVSSNNDAWGTTTGSNAYLKDSIATIKAIAAAHYHFTQWDDNNIENPRDILVSQDSNFVAIFAIDQHQIVVASNNSAWGTVTGSGSYDYGETITIEAIHNDGYHFEAWSDGDTINPRTLTVTNDTVLVANFDEGYPAGIDDLTDDIQLSLYPNPTTGTIHIETEGIQQIEVYNILGKCVARYIHESMIDLSRLTSGTYTIKIMTTEGWAVRRIIKQ